MDVPNRRGGGGVYAVAYEPCMRRRSFEQEGERRGPWGIRRRRRGYKNPAIGSGRQP